MPTTVPSGSLITPGGDQGPSGATSSLASTSAPGLLQQISGNVTDYVGGDNSCHPLPIQVGGRLSLLSATQLQFVPFNGNWIKINGFFYPIPTTGIVGLTNTGCYIDGVVGNLVASSLYRVYCWNNAGTLTAEFSGVVHATSSTPGNIGTEIKSGNDSRTLIGMIYTNASSQFVDSTSQRWTRSWLNGGRISFAIGASISVTSTSYAGTPAVVMVLTWAGEPVVMTANGYGTATAVTNVTFILYIDGGSTGSASAISTTSTTSKYENFAASWAAPLSETLHTLQLYAAVSAANTFSGQAYLSGIIG